MNPRDFERRLREAMADATSRALGALAQDIVKDLETDLVTDCIDSMELQMMNIKPDRVLEVQP